MAESEREPISERDITWEERQMNADADPRDPPELVLPDGTAIPSHLDRLSMLKVLISMINKVQPLRRIKMAHVNTLDDVVHLLRSCCGESSSSLALKLPSRAESHIICSRIRIYPRLSGDFPTPPDPQAMFDIHFFRKDPQHRQIHRLCSTFISFARTANTARSTGYVRHPFLSQGPPIPPDPQAMFDIHFFRKDPQHRQIHRPCSTSISFARTHDRSSSLPRKSTQVISSRPPFTGHYQVWRQRDQGGHLLQVIPLCPKCRHEDMEASGEMACREAGRRALQRGLLSTLSYCKAMNLDKSQSDTWLRDNSLFSFSSRY
ncbi:hypothetical protein HPB48_020144 [Haemaphysalis longicornis]|uniref:Uncharacterized protein n=1 Tax=Haemaphysalis longicornis TaxID=44386 RepID=A0A9J6F8D7_HAELO|nr:hypothetical protein HPB48_020144 [Haemaphysalis longicornis]